MTHFKSARTGAIVLVGACVIALSTSLHLKSLAMASSLAPTSVELATALHRAGLHPEALTAAGLSASETDTVVENVLARLVEQPDLLGGIDQVYASARREHDRLLRRVRSGRASEEEVTAFQQARSSLASARAQRQGAVNELIEAGTADLSGPKQSTLAMIRLHRVWKQPTEFLTVERTEEEWVALRDALANERIAAAHGEDPDAEAQALLQQLRSHPSVSAAKANLDANLDLITAAWDDAAGL